MAVLKFTQMDDTELQENANFVFRNAIGQLSLLGLIPSDNAENILKDYGMVLVRRGWFRGVIDRIFGENKESSAHTFRVVKLGGDW